MSMDLKSKNVLNLQLLKLVNSVDTLTKLSQVIGVPVQQLYFYQQGNVKYASQETSDTIHELILNLDWNKVIENLIDVLKINAKNKKSRHSLKDTRSYKSMLYTEVFSFHKKFSVFFSNDVVAAETIKLLVKNTADFVYKNMEE